MLLDNFTFFARSAATLTDKWSYTLAITSLTFPYNFIFIVKQFLYTISPLSCAEFADSHSSVWSLPACCCPLPSRRVVEGLLTEAGICFLLSVAIQVCLI